MSKELSNEMYSFKHTLEASKEFGLYKINIDVFIEKIAQFAHRVSILEESISND